MTRKLFEILSRTGFPFLRDGFAHECMDSVGKLLLTCVVAIIGHVLVQDSPKSLNRIELGAVGHPASDGYCRMSCRERP